MKKIFLIITATAFTGIAYSQQVTVKPNASMTIKSNASFQFDALTLKPSVDLSLKGLIITNDTAVGTSLSNAYVPNTFIFSDTFTYSGSVQINYMDGQLNGITETDLQLGVYNGTGWQNAGTTIVDTVNDYVLTSGINALPVGELVLTNNIALSMSWGEAFAARNGQAVRISWNTFAEKNVHHFDIYRSTDGVNWTMAIAGIPALNKAQRSEYASIDAPAYNGKLYYRIRQVDIDGHFSFSKTLTVAALYVNVPMVVSPNPATSYFTISGANDISRIDLLNAMGTVVKSWVGYKSQYNLGGLAAGAYYLVVKTEKGALSRHPLIVK